MNNADEVVSEIVKDVLTNNPKDLEKKWKDEAYEKYIDKFRDCIHLWKLNDKEWVRHRKEIWGKIVEREKAENSDFSKSYWETMGRFFLRAKPRKSDKGLYNYHRITYTPFNSVDDIVAEYAKEHVSLRASLHDNLLTYANKAYRAVPEEFHRVQLIAEALYNKDYVAKMEPMGKSKRNKFVVTCPRDFIINYTREACYYIKRSENNYISTLNNRGLQTTGQERSFAEVTLDYFLGSLEYVMPDNNNEATRTINDYGIEGVKEMCALIESYNPDIDSESRDDFIAKSRSLILENKNVKKILAIS